MTSKTPLYHLFLTRDFALSTIQVWCDVESTLPKVWSEKLNPYKPFEVFVRKNDQVLCYADSDGIAWIKNHLLDLSDDDPDFIKNMNKTILELSLPFEDVCRRGSPIEKEQLPDFISYAQKMWSWFEAFWWLMHAFNERNDSRLVLLQEIRKEYEYFAPGVDKVFRNSFAWWFPQVKDFVDVITLSEALTANMPSDEELKSRMESYVYVQQKLLTKASLKDVESAYNISFEQVSANPEGVVQGQTAFPGLVKGKVKLLKGPDELDKVQDGDIILSSMTLPTFLPAIKRCAAIVTDEGGITCHAGIVAREFEIPCVIGTKNATITFKDGDLVEVDANKGIVRKIE